MNTIVPVLVSMQDRRAGDPRGGRRTTSSVGGRGAAPRATRAPAATVHRRSRRRGALTCGGDAQDESGEEFGDQRLLTVLQAAITESADTLVDRVFDAIDAFAGTAPQYDNITLLVLRKL